MPFPIKILSKLLVAITTTVFFDSQMDSAAMLLIALVPDRLSTSEERVPTQWTISDVRKWDGTVFTP